MDGPGYWLVQPTWTVGDDERSYPPTLVATEAEAMQVAAEIADTLGHFPTLEILVEFDRDAVPGAPLSEPPVRAHRAAGQGMAGGALCGAQQPISLSADWSWSDEALAPLEGRCEACQALHAEVGSSERPAWAPEPPR